MILCPLQGRGRRVNFLQVHLSSDGGVISAIEVQVVVDRLSMECFRDSTKQTNYRIWKLFNQFFIKLDDRPRSWNDRLVLFTGFLVDSQLQSATVKSYISAIKGGSYGNRSQTFTGPFPLDIFN